MYTEEQSKATLPSNVYTVQQAAEMAGVTDGLLYQKIKDGSIHTASEELLDRLGLPRYLRKPKHWLTEEEIERFLSAPRTTYKKN